MRWPEAALRNLKIFSALLLISITAACSIGSFGYVPVDGEKNPETSLETETASENGNPESFSPVEANLQVYGVAPDFHGSTWLNTKQAINMADLRGKVVLLEMWTFGCVNCKNVIPSLKAWHEKYHDEGLVIVANHYPEFAYERDLDNLKKAVVDYGIAYPVLQDNDGETWRAYNNRYWPALFLIDKKGIIRYKHIGEGAYSETEAAIQALLAEEFVE